MCVQMPQNQFYHLVIVHTFIDVFFHVQFAVFETCSIIDVFALSFDGVSELSLPLQLN